MKQGQPDAYPWGKIHWKLWLHSQVSMKADSSLVILPCPRLLRALPSPRAIATVFKEGRSVLFVSPREQTQHRLNPSHNLPMPIRAERLLHVLSGYTLSTTAYLYNGFKNLFSLHLEGQVHSFEAENLVSARDHPDLVSSKLGKELAAYRLAGPFHSPPFNDFRVSSLGVVPEKTPGEFRMIHHLLFPNGSSFNDGIPPEHTSVKYATIEDAICLVKQNGKGCFL